MMRRRCRALAGNERTEPARPLRPQPHRPVAAHRRRLRQPAGAPCLLPWDVSSSRSYRPGTERRALRQDDRRQAGGALRREDLDMRRARSPPTDRWRLTWRATRLGNSSAPASTIGLADRHRPELKARFRLKLPKVTRRCAPQGDTTPGHLAGGVAKAEMDRHSNKVRRDRARPSRIIKAVLDPRRARHPRRGAGRGRAHRRRRQAGLRGRAQARLRRGQRAGPARDGRADDRRGRQHRRLPQHRRARHGRGGRPRHGAHPGRDGRQGSDHPGGQERARRGAQREAPDPARGARPGRHGQGAHERDPRPLPDHRRRAGDGRRPARQERLHPRERDRRDRRQPRRPDRRAQEVVRAHLRRAAAS